MLTTEPVDHSAHLYDAYWFWIYSCLGKVLVMSWQSKVCQLQQGEFDCMSFLWH